MSVAVDTFAAHEHIKEGDWDPFLRTLFGAILDRMRTVEYIEKVKVDEQQPTK